MKRFWRVFKVLMFSLFLIGIYAFDIRLAIRFQGDYRLLVILMTIGMIAVTPKLIEKIKTHPDAEKKKPVKKRIYLLAYLAFSSALCGLLYFGTGITDTRDIVGTFAGTMAGFLLLDFFFIYLARKLDVDDQSYNTFRVVTFK